MSTLKEISNQFNLNDNELLVFQPITENFHPIAWLESVGQFLRHDDGTSINPSNDGRDSVLFEMI